MKISELQQCQSKYDSQYFTHENKSEFEQIRHITLHVMKLAGKLATYCEEKEHDKISSKEKIINEVIPDLLAFSLQLGNKLNINVENAYQKRLTDNMQRLSKLLNIID